MNYYSEKDIRDIVAGVLTQSGLDCRRTEGSAAEKEVPVEISARHVHLSKEALAQLFGEGYALTPKRDLSQPGQYLCEERVKLVTAKGEIANVAILGPVRPKTQVELSMTDARILGVKAPLRLSGDLAGSAEVILIGPKGVCCAKESTIVSKAHIHMTPDDARRYNVSDGEHIGIRLNTERAVTLENVLVRVTDASALAVHIDYDEANAAGLTGGTTGLLIKKKG